MVFFLIQPKMCFLIHQPNGPQTCYLQEFLLYPLMLKNMQWHYIVTINFLSYISKTLNVFNVQDKNITISLNIKPAVNNIYYLLKFLIITYVSPGQKTNTDSLQS